MKFTSFFSELKHVRITVFLIIQGPLYVFMNSRKKGENPLGEDFLDTNHHKMGRQKYPEKTVKQKSMLEEDTMYVKN